ncbi:MAG TPA: Ku protein [Candidatus Saccharimonadia bacterium]
MRAIWTGSLSFGLINIPVRLYSGSESRGGIELNMLHKDDLSPIRYAKICRKDGQEVPYDDIVKGYEYQDGDYVVLTDADFDKVNSRKTKTIDIEEFTDEQELDVRYYEKPYYLEPDKNSEKPYALLREALKRSHKIAVAKFVLRQREHLAAIKPVGRALVLNQLRFPSDLREPRQLDLPDAKIATGKEIDMALKLIDQLTGPFVPEDYKDSYTEELEAMIEAKLKGKAPKAEGKAPSATPAKDLMAMLKESLEKEKAKTTGK